MTQPSHILCCVRRPQNFQEETHPWLPGEKEPSQEQHVAIMTQRAPADLRPKLLQLQHHAMKGDMELQMSRIARGMEMERPLITHFKSKALDKVRETAHTKPRAAW